LVNLDVSNDDIAEDADLLLCDDLGDEWADFIDISTATSLAMVSLNHAKHGRRAVSASAFHESVGQAIENLGRMTLPSESMPAKYASWERVYRGPKARTTIPRIVRGGSGSAEGHCLHSEFDELHLENSFFG
jgi:hypothetical protein